MNFYYHFRRTILSKDSRPKPRRGAPPRKTFAKRHPGGRIVRPGSGVGMFPDTGALLTNNPLWLGDGVGDQCAVYVIAPEDETPIKIGHARNCILRLKGLQTQHWVDLMIYEAVWLPKEEAKKVEKKCHAILIKKGRRLRGEWFDITAEEGARLVSEVADALNVSRVDAISLRPTDNRATLL